MEFEGGVGLLTAKHEYFQLVEIYKGMKGMHRYMPFAYLPPVAEGHAAIHVTLGSDSTRISPSGGY